MRKLLHHKNILQLLDWNTAEGERPLNTGCYSCARVKHNDPLALCRTLHSHHGVCELRHSEDLPADPQGPTECGPRAAEPPHHRLLPHRPGYAASALQNGENITGSDEALSRKSANNTRHNTHSERRSSLQIVHSDLALRNIMVNKFPWEVKVAEFGLARDLTRVTSRHSTRWRNPRVRRYRRHFDIL